MTSPYRKNTETGARLPDPLPSTPLPATVVTMPSSAITPSSEKSADRQPDSQKARPQALEKVGDMLKREREKLGGDLQQIADYLRIRRAFLDALENSRYEEFVADAYIVGFLRSYAEHLGLNAKQVIDQYRREMAGRRKKLTLSMPVPVGEGRAPSAIILAGALAAALVVYIAWYAFSTADRTAVILPSTPAPVTSEAAPAATAAEPTAGIAAPGLTVAAVSSAPAPGPAPAAPAVVTPPAATAMPVSSTPTATSADIVLPVTAAGAATTTPADPTFGAGGKAAADAGGKLSAKAAAAKAELAREEARAAQDETPPLAAAPSTAAATAPPRDETAALNAAALNDAEAKAKGAVAPGVSPAPPHLTITAEETSWVLVNDRSGKTLFDRIMQAGETYRVPSQPGLKLTTGNGAGVRLTLDDKALPRLSNNTSQILRNISLDSDALKNLPTATGGE